VSDAGPRIVQVSDSGATSPPTTVTEQDDYSVSCQAQQRSSKETCVQTDQGAECATARRNTLLVCQPFHASTQRMGLQVAR
jgi:hypothetical protein